MTTTLTIGPHAFSDALLLAPMEDVSSAPFRTLCRRFGADLVFTEFVSAQGLIRETRESVTKIRIRPEERPCGIQLFGENPDVMAEAARRIMAAEPDLVDLNIGCPVRKVVAKGGGAALLRDLDLTERIVAAVRRVVTVPLTAKARIGWDTGSIRILELARLLEANGVDALTVHPRTRDQLYGGRADWRWIARVREAVSIPVVGNGDVTTPESARRMFEETGCHGVMLGRGAIGNPWLFAHIRHYLETGEHLPGPTPAERVAVLLEQLEAAVAEKGEFRGVREMRRQYGPYLRGFPGAAALRQELVRLGTPESVRALLERHLETSPSAPASAPASSRS